MKLKFIYMTEILTFINEIFYYISRVIKLVLLRIIVHRMEQRNWLTKTNSELNVWTERGNFVLCQLSASQCWVRSSSRRIAPRLWRGCRDLCRCSLVHRLALAGWLAGWLAGCYIPWLEAASHSRDRYHLVRWQNSKSIRVMWLV